MYRPLAVLLALTTPLFAQPAKLPTPGAGDDPALVLAWKELADPDEAKATRAALTLAARPADAVPFLKARLRPVKNDAKVVAKLVADLNSDDFRAREAAQTELEYFGKFIKGELEKQQAEANPEQKDRIKRLLDRIAAEDAEKNGPKAPPLMAGGGGVSISNSNGQVEIRINGQKIDLTPKVIRAVGPPAGWQRASRAVAVLEHVGTPDAVAVLEAMALGEDAAAPTTQAQDALARLKRKK